MEADLERSSFGLGGCKLRFELEGGCFGASAGLYPGPELNILHCSAASVVTPVDIFLILVGVVLLDDGDFVDSVFSLLLLTGVLEDCFAIGRRADADALAAGLWVALLLGSSCCSNLFNRSFTEDLRPPWDAKSAGLGCTNVSTGFRLAELCDGSRERLTPVDRNFGFCRGASLGD